MSQITGFTGLKITIYNSLLATHISCLGFEFEREDWKRRSGTTLSEKIFTVAPGVLKGEVSGLLSHLMLEGERSHLNYMGK